LEVIYLFGFRKKANIKGLAVMLMERNPYMTEREALYISKTAMKKGEDMDEIAEMAHRLTLQRGHGIYSDSPSMADIRDSYF
jgi:hypothetical protein